MVTMFVTMEEGQLWNDALCVLNCDSHELKFKTKTQ